MICPCGHGREAHLHYRRGTQCSLCDCRDLPRTRFGRWFRLVRNQPPGIWLGQPRIGARWRHDGQVFVLASFRIEEDFIVGRRVLLEYQDANSWQVEQWMTPDRAARGGEDQAV